MLGAVVAQHMVHIGRSDPAQPHQLHELLQAHPEQRRQQLHVLAQPQHAVALGRRGVRQVQPATRSGAARGHADGVPVGVRHQMDPVHPQARTVRPRYRFHDHRTGTVGQRPAQELRVEPGPGTAVAALPQ